MIRLIIAAIIGLIIASVAVPQDTHLPLILGGNATAGNTPTTTATMTSTGSVTPTGTTTATGTTTPTFTPTGTATATSTATATGTTTQTPTTTATGTTTPTPTQTGTATATGTTTATPTTTPTATATEPVAGPCPCNADLRNCSNFDTQPEAQACMDFCVSQGQGDIHNLDGDANGKACESLPGGFTVVR